MSEGIEEGKKGDRKRMTSISLWTYFMTSLLSFWNKLFETNLWPVWLISISIISFIIISNVFVHNFFVVPGAHDRTSQFWEKEEVQIYLDCLSMVDHVYGCECECVSISPGNLSLFTNRAATAMNCTGGATLPISCVLRSPPEAGNIGKSKL